MVSTISFESFERVAGLEQAIANCWHKLTEDFIKALTPDQLIGVYRKAIDVTPVNNEILIKILLFDNLDLTQLMRLCDISRKNSGFTNRVLGKLSEVEFTFEELFNLLHKTYDLNSNDVDSSALLEHTLEPSALCIIIKKIIDLKPTTEQWIKAYKLSDNNV